MKKRRPSASEQEIILGCFRKITIFFCCSKKRKTCSAVGIQKSLSSLPGLRSPSEDQTFSMEMEIHQFFCKRGDLLYSLLSEIGNKRHPLLRRKTEYLQNFSTRKRRHLAFLAERERERERITYTPNMRQTATFCSSMSKLFSERNDHKPFTKRGDSQCFSWM